MMQTTSSLLYNQLMEPIKADLQNFTEFEGILPEIQGEGIKLDTAHYFSFQ